MSGPQPRRKVVICEPSGKVRHRTREEAEHCLLRRRRTGYGTAHIPVTPTARAYPCGTCGGWHLTSGEEPS